MSISISKAGPYFSSGSISFSQLSATFRFSGGQIKASELRRNTNVDETNPIVPDATENASISSGSNLRLSQFRNSIKYYSITQTGTDSSLSLDDNSYWNGNLGKNIVKNTYVNGTNGNSDLNVAAIRHRGDRSPTRNLTITVNGAVYGCKGWGGGRGWPGADITGTRGGAAFRVEGSGGGNARVRFVMGSGIVWAGGGGGERGKNGDNGANGQCRENTRTQGCGGRPGCPSGFYETGQWSGGCCQSYSYCCGLFNCGCTACSRYLQGRTCARDYTIAGGIGGIGGRGGFGRGYDNSGSLSGEAGTLGQNPTQTCGGNQTVVAAQKGKDGERGADGGEWGRPGGDTQNIGRGGRAGPAIYGNNFTLEGNVNSNTVRGYIDYAFGASAEYNN